MVKFDNFEGLKSVLKFHIFMYFKAYEVSVRFRLTCDDLVWFSSDEKNWYQIFRKVKNWYLIFTCVSDII